MQGQIDDMQHYAASKAFNESIGLGDVKVKHTQEGADDDKAPF